MSSTIDYSTFSMPLLLASRTRIDEVIMARSAGVAPAAAAAGKKGAKKNKDGTEKVKRKGSPGAWSDWTKKVMTDCDAEIKAFKEAAEKKAGAHLKWISANKGKTSPEWLAFKADWDASHPKAAKGAKEASDAEEAEEDEDSDSPAAVGGGGSVAAAAASVAAPAAGEKVAKKRGPKKLADMTPDEKAKHDAGVAERKAKKAAVVAAEAAAVAAAGPVQPKPVAELMAAAEAAAAPKPVAVPVAVPAAEEEGSIELKIFILDGQKYMRLWSSAANDWHTTDLWYTTKKGERGAYWGELMEDGSVNADAEEPELD
jgi:hypothetical protein